MDFINRNSAELTKEEAVLAHKIKEQKLVMEEVRLQREITDQSEALAHASATKSPSTAAPDFHSQKHNWRAAERADRAKLDGLINHKSKKVDEYR